MFIDPTTAVAIGKASLDAWNNRKPFLPFLKKLGYWVRHGYLRVSVFGEGGTGKSYLADLLEKGNIDPALYSKPYDASTFSEDRKIGAFSGNIFGKVTVPPGQSWRAEREWPREYYALSHGKSTGVINVVSWGYHALNESYKNTKYYHNGMSAKQFLNAYSEERRQKELEALKIITPRIIDADPRKKIWMITLVTKQDLWWQERSRVSDFYITGTYNEYIERIAEARGNQYFTHEYLSASLVIRNFVTGGGELLASTAPGYEQSIQFLHLNKFMTTIENFANQ